MKTPMNVRHGMMLVLVTGTLTASVAFAQHNTMSHADSVRRNLLPKSGKASLSVMQPHSQPAPTGSKPTLSVMQPHTQPAPAGKPAVVAPHQQPAQPMGKPTLSVMQPHAQPAPNGGKPTLSVMQPHSQPKPGEPRQAIGNPSLGPPRNEPPPRPSGDRAWREHHDQEQDSHHGHAYGRTKKHGNPHGMPPGQAKKHGDEHDDPGNDKDHGHH